MVAVVHWNNISYIGERNEPTVGFPRHGRHRNRHLNLVFGYLDIAFLFQFDFSKYGQLHEIVADKYSATHAERVVYTAFMESRMLSQSFKELLSSNTKVS